MNTNLRLKFVFGDHNGRMKITVNDQQISTEVVDLNIELPTVLKINLTGKNYSSDTLVDSMGNITADKFVQLAEMRLGGIPIEEVNLLKIVNYNTDQGATVQSAYWGFNGIVTFNFNQPNFIKYLLTINNKFNLTN